MGGTACPAQREHAPRHQTNETERFQAELTLLEVLTLSTLLLYKYV